MPNGFMHTLLWHMKCECVINTDKNMIEGIRSEPACGVGHGIIMLSYYYKHTNFFLLDCIMILFDKSAETRLTDLDLI